jgi:hypothetical protein
MQQLERIYHPRLHTCGGLEFVYSPGHRTKWPEILGTLALAMCEVRPTDIRGMDCEDGKLIILGQIVLSGAARKGKISSIRDPGSGIQMDKDHLPLLEDQNPL